MTARAKPAILRLHEDQQALDRFRGDFWGNFSAGAAQSRRYFNNVGRYSAQFQPPRTERAGFHNRGLAGFITGAALIIGDLGVLIGLLAGVLAYATCCILELRPAPGAWASYFVSAIPSVLPYAGSMFVLLVSRGHYSRKLSGFTEVGDVFGASAAFLGVYLLTQFSSSGTAWFWWGVSGWLVLPFVVLAVRGGVRWLLSKAGIWHTPVVLVGGKEDVAAAQSVLGLARSSGFQGVGVVDTANLGDDVRDGYWCEVLRDYKATRLVLAMDTNHEASNRVLRSVVRDGVPFTVLPKASSLPVVGYNHTLLFSHNATLTHFRGNRVGVANRLLKTAVDICAALLLLTVFAPLMVILALVIRRDGGPVIFAHERVGLGGRKFRCLKFRSMVTDPVRVMREHLESDPDAAAEWATTQKLTNDPRITPIGRFLRATSLDELPQLVNILRLEMSLVGPRPITEAELARYGDDVTYYLRARPGLTGLWQVSGRSDVSYSRRVELDAWYVRNQNWWHDLVILVLTIPAVLKRNGAR